MRKLIVLACLVGLFAVTAVAADTSSYPRGEFFGGYQYTRLEGGVNANGFDFSANGNFNNYFGITADIGAAFASQAGVSFNNYTYTFGPTLSLRANKAYTPFVHVLLGGDHASASFAGVSGSGSGLAVLAGGGVDFNFNRYMAFRGAADWMMLHGSGGTSSKNFRMPIGIVFKF